MTIIEQTSYQYLKPKEALKKQRTLIRYHLSEDIFELTNIFSNHQLYT